MSRKQSEIRSASSNRGNEQCKNRHRPATATRSSTILPLSDRLAWQSLSFLLDQLVSPRPQGKSQRVLRMRASMLTHPNSRVGDVVGKRSRT